MNFKMFNNCYSVSISQKDIPALRFLSFLFLVYLAQLMHTGLWASSSQTHHNHKTSKHRLLSFYLPASLFQTDSVDLRWGLED